MVPRLCELAPGGGRESGGGITQPRDLPSPVVLEELRNFEVRLFHNSVNVVTVTSTFTINSVG